MLITRIELENIKSYRSVSVDLGRGTTAISGSNGAGKTTLVEAIGYALFGYLPYNQDQFVREGEKNGKIVVHLIGSDSRPYTVERRCGSAARWQIYDEEANARVEQRADVLDKLHDIFGIDRERPLDALFRDALGVPQGTFTSIFIEVASKRKQTFDALLQIEDYQTAAKKLLDTQNYYKEQMQAHQSEMNQLTYEIRDLETWRLALQDARKLDEQQKAQSILWTQQRAQQRDQLAILRQQRDHLNKLEQRYINSQKEDQLASERLRDYEKSLAQARNAQQIVAASQADFQLHEQAGTALKQLRQRDQARQALRDQQAGVQRALAKSQAQEQNWQSRLDDVATARQKAIELAPLVKQQVALEQQRDAARQSLTRYKSILEEEKRLTRQQADALRKQGEIQRKISAIEPLVPLAEQLPEHNERLNQLRIQSNERKNKQQQWEEKSTLLQEKQGAREGATGKLRQAERNLEIIEANRQAAEEMVVLQGQLTQLDAQKHHLEGNIEAYSDSREKSAGGQCPLLHEACLNIKQRGITSLAFYFDDLLQKEHDELAQLTRQQQTITTRVKKIEKVAEAVSKANFYEAKRDAAAEQLQSIYSDIVRLQNEIVFLDKDLSGLEQVEQQIAEAERAFGESKRADISVRELRGLDKQVQQLQEQIRQYEADIQERRQSAEALSNSAVELQQAEAALLQLNDPRSDYKNQQTTINDEPRLQQELQEEQRRSQQFHQQLDALVGQLAAFATLDSDMRDQEVHYQRSQEGYQQYLTYTNDARLLPEREAKYQQQIIITDQAHTTLQQIERDYLSAQENFNIDALATLEETVKQLEDNLTNLASEMRYHQEKIKQLEQSIAAAEEIRLKLEAIQREHQELEELHTMTEQFRKLIKEAGPYVLKAMLGDISAESNRIFGEIMGDRSAQLSWENEYEIFLRRQGVKRTFAQLSGGEQMSAALAIRLALLKKLSNLNIAFFDEPTQNMDELRRTNLAEQIRRVRGFDQLVVISHDDTFEQGLDGLIRLRKDGGETLLLSDDDGEPRREPRKAPGEAVLW